MIIDLRSDTVTRPGPGMLNAMMSAKVGDDVYEEDETVIALEQRLANDFGMEAGLFCPSGTMTNQVAIRVHARSAEELICAGNAHIYKYEGAGIAANSGVQARVIPTSSGKLHAAQIAEVINGDDVHFPVTSLVCLENTSNRGGGSVYVADELKAIRHVCDKHKLMLHLDGARVYNALEEADYTAKDLGMWFDSISICLSKGLGAPVGSVLIGTRAFIHQAKRVRKMMGGGMRQAGYLAAAGLYALDHHVDRIKQDHAHTKAVAKVLEEHSLVEGMLPVESNIIIFKMINNEIADKFRQHLKDQHILANKVSPTELRFVFHLDVSPEMVDRLIGTIKSFTA